ncbi:MAG TPA: MFS transporter [Steroidobacteraceae bacterium]|nr:MFS transporter [Steroidobacteraceae bacterium]
MPGILAQPARRCAGAARARHDFGARAFVRALKLSASAASRPLILGAVFSSCLGVGLIFGFQPPLIALSLSRSGSSSFAIGAVTAASLVAVILLGPLYPRAIARLGLKRCIVIGVGIAALILLLMPVWPSVPIWLVLRFLSGCALGLTWIASEIWMNTVSDDKSRGTIMGIYGTVFSLGIIGGPVLLEFTGTRGWRPFAVGALCLGLTLVPLAVLRTVKSAAPSFAALGGLMSAVRAAPLVMLAAVVAGLVESADLALLPLFGLHAGIGEKASLLLVTVFMAGNVVLQMPIGLLADRFGRRFLLGICALLSGIGPLLLPACIHRSALLGPLLIVWGGTLYAFYSQGVALLGEEFPAAELPRANTVFVMVYCLGGVIGPSLGGYAMDVWPSAGLPVLLSSAALLMLAGLAMRRGKEPVQTGS